MYFFLEQLDVSLFFSLRRVHVFFTILSDYFIMPWLSSLNISFDLKINIFCVHSYIA